MCVLGRVAEALAASYLGSRPAMIDRAFLDGDTSLINTIRRGL